MHYQFAEFTLDAGNETLSGPSGPIPLRRRAFLVLRALLEHAPALVMRDRLLDEVWGHDALSATVLPQAIGEIRQALGDDAQSPRLIETRHRRGYRMLVSVRRLPMVVADGTAASDVPAVPAPTADAGIAPSRRSRVRHWPTAAAVVALALLAGLASWGWLGRGESEPMASSRPALAILSGSIAGGPDWLPRAGRELLTVALSTDERVHLVRGDGRGDEGPAGGERWQFWMHEVLGADYALTGVWSRNDAGVLSFDYTLLRLDDGRVAHAGRVEGGDLATLCGDVARDLREHLRLIAPDTGWLAELPANAKAREAYYEGVAALDDGDAGRAVGALESALADPQSGSRVRIALASAYRRSGRLVQAREQFAQVLAGDRSTLPVGERLRTEAEAALVEDRPADAAASLRALHQLVPDDAEVAFALVDAQLRSRQAQAAAGTLAALGTLASTPVEDPRWHLAQARLAALRNDNEGRRAAAARALELAKRFDLPDAVAEAGLEGVQAMRAEGDLRGARAQLETQLAQGVPELLVPLAQLQLGSLLRDLGEFDLAERNLREAGEAYARRGDRTGALRAHIERHIIESERGHNDAAYAELAALEPAVSALGDSALMAVYYNTIGIQAVRNRRNDDARAHLQRAASEARRAGQPDREAGVYNNLAQLFARNRQPEEAMKVWQQALEVFRDIGDRKGEAITLSNQAATGASLPGGHARSIDLNQQALALFRTIGATQHAARTSFNLALGLEREGDLVAATGLLEEALADYRAGSARDPVLHVGAALARVQLARAHIEAVRVLLDSLQADFDAVSEPLARSHVVTARGHLAALAGEPEIARDHYRQALRLRSDPGWKWSSELDLLALDLLLGRPAAAVRAGTERVAARQAQAGEVRDEARARLIEAAALLRMQRREPALAALARARVLLDSRREAAASHELDRLTILAAADTATSRRERLAALAADVAGSGFAVIAWRCRLDAAALTEAGIADERAGLAAEIHRAGLAGLLGGMP